MSQGQKQKYNQGGAPPLSQVAELRAEIRLRRPDSWATVTEEGGFRV